MSAAKRGVRIQIITPGEHMDAETVRKASRARWGDLLEAGVEIFEYQPTMRHCKLMVVDTTFAARQIEIVQQDLARSRAISLDECGSGR